MSKESYSIPQKATDRFDFQRNAIDLSTTNADAWGIPATLFATIVPLRSKYEQCYSVASNKSTRSTAIVAAREEAWGNLLVPLTELYDQHLINNSAINAADKISLNLNTGSGRGSTVTPAAVTIPVVLLVAEEASLLHVVFTDSASVSGSHAKPNGVAFCEIWAKIDGAAPTSPSDCTEHYNISRNHEGIVFNPGQRTKTMYGFARWVNKNGKVGIWGNMFSAIIP